MTIPIRAGMTVLVAIALVVVAVKFILPLIAMYVGGVGVTVPIPHRIVRAYPRLAIGLFIFGAPLVFLALLATGVWLIWARH